MNKKTVKKNTHKKTVKKNTNKKTQLPTVTIVGGTHGNEMMGIYLLNHIFSNFKKYKRKGFQTLPIIGNPLAVYRMTRFIDTDLNRIFTKKVLENNNTINSSYEELRARELAFLLKKSSIILDLHNTTSNSGTMLIIGDTKPLTLHLIQLLISKNQERKVWLNITGSGSKSASNLGSLAPYNIGIEIGPDGGHGICTADVFKQGKDCVNDLLDICNMLFTKNRNDKLNKKTLEVYRWTGDSIYFPMNKDREIIAAIHPDFQGSDYKLLKNGDPIFLYFDGKVKKWEGSNVYPVFIEEVAYSLKPPNGNNQNIAFFPCKKENMVCPEIRISELLKDII